GQELLREEICRVGTAKREAFENTDEQRGRRIVRTTLSSNIFGTDYKSTTSTIMFGAFRSSPVSASGLLWYVP
ncbi:hypothetical protein FRC01_004905, partial [Tulasnella sp. 417]